MDNSVEETAKAVQEGSKTINSQFNEILEKSISGKSEDCCEYYHANIDRFLKENKNIEPSINKKLKLLSSISSFVFHPYNIDENPLYGLLMVIGAQRSIKIDDLTDAELSILEEISNEINNLELKARVCDVLWLKREKYEFAVLAIDCLIKQANRFLGKKTKSISKTNHFKDRLLRATQLTLEINNKDYKRKIKLYLKICVKRIEVCSKNNYLFEQIAYIALKAEEENLGQFKSKVLLFLENEKSNFEDIRRFYQILVSILKIEKNSEEENKVLKKISETWVKQSKLVLKSESPSFMLCATFIKEALKGYLLVKSPDKERTKELEKLLEKYNKKSLDEMKTLSTTVDITKLEEENNKILEIIKRDCNKDIVKTLISFCSQKILTKNNLLTNAKNLLNKSIAHQICNVQHLGKDGKQIATGDPIKSQAIRNLSFYWDLGTLRINRIRDYIINTFSWEEIQKGIETLIVDHPILSKDRYKILSRALIAGFSGDWIVSSHIIPEQIEHILRERLKVLDVYRLKVKRVNKEQTQQDYNINDFFSGDYKKILSEDVFFNEDIIFHLQALLTHNHGANLRNEIYHGLKNDKELELPVNTYLWWFFLKMLIDIKIKFN